MKEILFRSFSILVTVLLFFHVSFSQAPAWFGIAWDQLEGYYGNGILLTDASTSEPKIVKWMTHHQIDTFQLIGQDLKVSFKGDSVAAHIVNLSSINTDAQILSTAGTPGDISISGGNNITLNVDDADASTTNELNSSMAWTDGTNTLSVTDPGGTKSAIITGFLESETDPIYSASIASGILAQDTINWNTAYGWGDHSAAGYLTSFTEVDPIFAASIASGITALDTANWNTAYGWGDHSTAGYLTSFTEVDPIFTASIASGITALDTANWNTAYGWGDHSAVGYLTTEVDGSISNEVNSYMSWDDATNTVGVADAYGLKSVIVTGFLESETDPLYSAWTKDYNDLINTPTQADMNYWTKSGNNLTYDLGNVGTTNYWNLLQEQASNVNPNIVPEILDPDSGIGWYGYDAPSIIAGSQEAARYTEDAGEITIDHFGDTDNNGYLQLGQPADNVSSRYKFDGVNNYITVSNNNNINFGTSDFSYRVKTTISKKHRSLYIRIGGLGATGFAMYYYNNKFEFDIRDTSTRKTLLFPGNNIVADQVYDIVATHDRDGFLKIYINGIFKSQIDISSITASITINSHLYIGSLPSSIWTIKDEISKIELYNRVLTQNEVELLYRGQQVLFADVGANQTDQNSGTLTIGKRYRITTFITGDDFTNVGAASNADGVEFIATGTTPTTWTNLSVVNQIGCVLNLNETGISASTWYDQSGNALDGTVTGAAVVNYRGLHSDGTDSYVSGSLDVGTIATGTSNNLLIENAGTIEKRAMSSLTITESQISDLTHTVNTDAQTVSTSGAAGDISISGGNNITLNVDDADASTTNELNSSMGWVDGSNTISVTDGGGAKSVVITGFLESETDPLYAASIASGIIATDTTNWNTAFGWGDHSAAGYITTEVDGDLLNEVNSYMSWNNATNTVGVADAGGLKEIIITGFLESETDPIYSAWTKDYNDLTNTPTILSHNATYNTFYTTDKVLFGSSDVAGWGSTYPFAVVGDFFLKGKSVLWDGSAYSFGSSGQVQSSDGIQDIWATIGLGLSGSIFQYKHNGTVVASQDLSSINTDAQTVSTTGTAGNISISGGNTITLNVDDADASTTNELNSSMAWTDGTNTISVTDPGGTKSAIITGFLESEVDGSTTNELQNVDVFSITSGATGGLMSVSLSNDATTATVDIEESVEDLIGDNVTAGAGIAVTYTDATGKTEITADGPKFSRCYIDAVLGYQEITGTDTDILIHYEEFDADGITSITSNVVHATTSGYYKVTVVLKTEEQDNSPTEITYHWEVDGIMPTYTAYYVEDYAARDNKIVTISEILYLDAASESITLSAQETGSASGKVYVQDMSSFMVEKL